MTRPVTGLLVVVLLLAGCQTAAPVPVDFTPVLARFFLESSEPEAAAVVLPLSGVRIAIGAKPVLTEGDIVKVELMQVDLGKCLMFQVTPAAARDLYRLSASNQGRRMILLLNGVAFGARRIDGPMVEGAVFVFVEVADTALPELVENLRKTVAKLQRELARKS